MTHTPPGWYPDHLGQIRYWDGMQWTDQVHNVKQARKAAQKEQARRARKVLLPVAGILLVVTVLIVGAVILFAVRSNSGNMDAVEKAGAEFMDGFVAHDCPAMWGLLTEPHQDRYIDSADFCEIWSQYRDEDARWVIDEELSVIEGTHPQYHFLVETLDGGSWQPHGEYQVTIMRWRGDWLVESLH